jgi:hypothetical protein
VFLEIQRSQRSARTAGGVAADPRLLACSVSRNARQLHVFAITVTGVTDKDEQLALWCRDDDDTQALRLCFQGPSKPARRDK